MKEHYKFELKPLPYAYDALEPYIDAETVRIHHNNHLKTYVDNLNKALAGYPQFQSYSLEELILCSDNIPKSIQTAVINNAGGVYNHNLYFESMKPGGGMPFGNLKAAIDRDFGSFDRLKTELSTASIGQFGSGYGWLAADECGRLKILSTLNQYTPLDLALKPIILVDVWEHAYYLKYQYRRPDYVHNWFNLIDWEKAAKRYAA